MVWPSMFVVAAVGVALAFGCLPAAAAAGNAIAPTSAASSSPVTVSAAAAAATPPCDYPCSATLTSATGASNTFDFSSGCSDTDYVASDTLGHTYNFNICRRANQACLPSSWHNPLESGVAVQRWGAKPACPPDQCTSKATGKPACCTEDCFVLGAQSATMPATWSLRDPSNITGGVILTYTAPPTYDAQSPMMCVLDPDGNQYNRTITYQVWCDPAQEDVNVILVEQIPPTLCQFEVVMSWREACAPGWATAAGA